MTSTIPESKQNPSFYPDYCHPLSRTISTWVPLRIKDIYTLEESGWSLEDTRDENTRSRYFLFNNHPLRWVKVTAVVVQIDYHEKNNKKVFILDDGTGVCIECSALNAPKPVFTNERSRHLDQLEQIAADPRRNEEVSEQGKRKVVKGGNTPSRANPKVPWNDIDVGMVVRVKGKIGCWWGQYQIESVILEVMRGLDAEVKGWNAARQFKEDVLDKPWILTSKQEEKCRRAQQQKMRELKTSGNDDKENRYGKKSTDSKGTNGKAVVHRTKERPRRDEPDRSLKRRKDLEKVQKMDGLVKKRDDTENDREERRMRAEAIALARKQVAGKFPALGI